MAGTISCIIIKEKNRELTKEEGEGNIDSNTKEKNNTYETLDFSILKMSKVILWLATFVTQTLIQAIPTTFLPCKDVDFSL